MLRVHDGTPEGLRGLLLEQVLPAIEKTAASQLLCLPVPSVPPSQGNAKFHLEQHQFTELCFCLRGQAEMWMGEQLAFCREHQLVVIPAGVTHSAAALHCVTANPQDVFSRLLWLSIFPFGAVVNACESAYGVHRSTARHLFLSPDCQLLVERILSEMHHRRANSDVLIKALLLQLLINIGRGSAVQGEELAQAANIAEAPVQQTAASLSDKVRQEIQRHYYLPDLGLEMLARAVGSNKSHVSRQFKLDTGLTVTNYLNQVRVDAAKRLLLAGLKVAAVAEYVGFSDAYYFSRVFTRLCGCAPSEYRKRGGE